MTNKDPNALTNNLKRHNTKLGYLYTDIFGSERGMVALMSSITDLNPTRALCLMQRDKGLPNYQLNQGKIKIDRCN